ncbi:MAG: C4-dicarboxylate ABC transporter permease [Gemmatimonadales bacterium]|nr:C4-dicarboxylate ABC transporter permease [Gammaproteobacteria bacterium]MYK02336.1 C4-dicarboxylate ABC transporter permease [Candidatus Palauibacter ramosifaciens]
MSAFLDGLLTALQPGNLAALFAGSLLGVFAGAMPGLSSTVGLALVLPVTFALDPTPALLMMVSIYMAAEYGGSITAIAIGVPGSSPALATTFDGYAMTRRGEAGRALGISLFSSMSGGLLGTILLVLALGPLSRAAIAFGPAEYFGLGVFGLSIVANLVGKDPFKGIVSALLGLLFFIVGLDVLTGAPRLTFGTNALMDGLGLVPMLIGFFAIAEALGAVTGRRRSAPPGGGIAGALPKARELFGLWRTILRGSAIGSLIGAIPGAGATIASIVAWNEERRVSKTPERFGTGVPAGIAAPEAANNSCVGAAMIPLLALGIPGSASAAVLLGGLTVQGVAPGPLLMTERSELVYALYAGFVVAVLLMLAVGRLGIPLWTRVVRLRPSILMPLVVAISLVGTFSLRGNAADAWAALFFGLVGFAMLRGGYPLAPAVLGLILGPMIETNYRRALSLSSGSHSIFLESPISLVLILLAAVSFAAPAVRSRLVSGRTRAPRPEPDTHDNEPRREEHE